MNGPAEEKKSHTATIILSIALLPLLYLLSYGPASMIPPSNAAVNRWILRIYTPVSWLYDHAPVARKPLENYVNWWVDLSQ